MYLRYGKVEHAQYLIVVRIMVKQLREYEFPVPIELFDEADGGIVINSSGSVVSPRFFPISGYGVRNSGLRAARAITFIFSIIIDVGWFLLPGGLFDPSEKVGTEVIEVINL